VSLLTSAATLIVLIEPLGELAGEEFAEEGADADAGKIITAGAEAVLFLFIESIIWTIEGQLHEAGKGDNTAGSYLFGDDFGEIFQLLAEWCGFSYQADRPYRIYGENRRILQLDVRAKGFGPAPGLGQ